VAVSRTSALPNEIAGLRKQILDQGRIDSDRAFSRTVGAPLELSGGNIELYTVPGYGGGMRNAILRQRLDRRSCTRRADIDQRLAASGPCQYPEHSFVLSTAALPQLRSFAEKAKATPDALIRAIAFIPATAKEDAVMLAEARVSYLSRA
jgi:hypothetical protein